MAAKIAAARRRMGRALFAQKLGPCLLAGGIVAAVVVVAIKLFADRLGFAELSPVVWVCVVAIPLVVGALAALLMAKREWPTELAAASALDEVAGTHDALGSSLAISSRGAVSGFELLSVAKGQAAADAVSPKDVASVRFGPSVLYAGGCVVLAGLVAAFAPMRSFQEPGPQPIVRVQTPEAVSEASEKLAEAKDAIESAASIGQASDEELSEIAELEQELAEGLRDPEDAIAAAAETLQQASEQAAKRAELDRVETDTLRERLNSIDPERFESARDLAEDLSSGDFESAAESAEQLLEQMRSDPAQAEQIADELRELADQIEQEQNNESGEQTDQAQASAS